MLWMGIWLQILLLITVVGADLLSKDWILNNLLERRDITPFLAFDLSINRGIGFGLFSGANAKDIVIAVTSAIVVILLVMWWRERHILRRTAITLVIAGALGNIIGRIMVGGVVDFIDLYWGSYHWFTFNVADIAITLGVVMLFALSLLGGAPSSKR